MKKAYFGKVGTSEQVVDMRDEPQAPQDFIPMASERPSEGEWLAQADGVWVKVNPCDRLCTALDRFASTVRKRFISGDADVISEYQRAETTARAYAEAGYTGEVPAPVASHATHYGTTPEEAAGAIIAMADAMNLALDAIRDARLGGKRALMNLSEDSSEATYQAVFDTWYNILDAISE